MQRTNYARRRKTVVPCSAIRWADMADSSHVSRDRVATAVPGVTGLPQPSIPMKLRRIASRIDVWFWGIVGLPTILAAVYFFGIASNVYLSKVEFVVRTPDKPPVTNITSLLSGVPSAPSLEDIYAVADFMMSRDAVRKLEVNSRLRSILGSRDGDFVSRFPGLLSLGRDDSEALFDAYKRFVGVDIDSQSGIATLQVKAYRAADAQLVARNLLTYGEQLVNDMNTRARADSLNTFEQEVRAAQGNIERVQAQLMVYREKQNMLDPKSAATGPLELIAKLTAEQVAAQTQLTDLLKNSSSSPQIPLLETRITSLGQSIETARARVTGSQNSVASEQSGYEQLTVQLALDEKALDSAFSSLESARLEVQRQQLYLETIVTPNLPDYPIYPMRFVSFLIVSVSCFIIYGIAWLLVASVREHVSA